MKWQAIVFDLDDTLYPEREYVLSGFRAVSQEIAPKLESEPHAIYQLLADLFHQGVRGNTFNIVLEKVGAPSEWVRECVDVYRAHTPRISTFPEVPGLLTELQSMARIGLISDGYLTVQQKKFKALELDRYFDAVTFSDQWGRDFWKPHTRSFEHTQQALNAERIVYIGDNPKKDFKGARACGWDTIWIRRPEGEYAALTPPEPDYAADRIIDSLTQIQDEN